MARPIKTEVNRHAAKFAELKALADAGIRDAMVLRRSSKRCPFDGEAINWGDLSCVRVEYYVGDAGPTDHGYRILIEEANPDSPNLALHVQRFLAGRGHPDVSVTTEW
jgi:hypothetical protein